MEAWPSICGPSVRYFGPLSRLSHRYRMFVPSQRICSLQVNEIIVLACVKEVVKDLIIVQKYRLENVDFIA
jgi:hypothetical protein